MSDGGKGSSPRPYAVSKDEFNERFDKIFGEPKSKHCADCNKLPSWCNCGVSVSIKKEEDDHLGGQVPKQTDFEVTIKKTWEF
jgi:hypothetical protein